MNSTQINGGVVVQVVIDGVVAWNGWLKIVLYLIVGLNANSNDGVANTLSAVCLCLWVRFKVFASLARAQFVKLSPRFLVRILLGEV